jgi:hypothetical protein
MFRSLFNEDAWYAKANYKLRGSCPQANYTDRRPPLVGEVTAFAGRGFRVVSAMDPTAVNLGFLDRNRYFFIQVTPQLSSGG